MRKHSGMSSGVHWVAEGDSEQGDRGNDVAPEVFVVDHGLAQIQHLQQRRLRAGIRLHLALQPNVS